MKTRLLTICMSIFVAMSAMMAQADAVLTYKEKYGDHMGTSNSCQSKDFYFFTANGDTARHVFQTAGTSGVFEVQNVYYYTYDEKGNLIHVTDYQYRPAYNDWSRRDSIAYEYNENGVRIAEIGGRNTYTHTLDANGNIIQTVNTVTSTGQVLQTITYSDFVPGAVNKPRKYESEGAYAMYAFSGTRDYDASHRIIVDDRLTATGSKMQRYEYTYDANGVCVSEKWYTSTSWTPEMITPGSAEDTLMYSKEITRTFTDNKYYKVVERVKDVVDWDENFNYIYAWTTQPATYHEYYAPLAENTVATGLTLKNVSTDDEPNCVKVTAQAPAALTGVKYLIWRNWEVAATVEAVDGVIEYVDKNVESATHAYFVQAYDAVNHVYYNVTDLTFINMMVNLPAVSDIKLVGGRKGTATDNQTGTTYDTYFITLQWEIPASPYAVNKFEIYQKPFAMPIATVNGSVFTAELSMPDGETADIRIDAVYDLGIATGDYVSFKWDSSKEFEGEQQPDVLTLVKQDEGGYLTLNLYNADNNIYRAKSLMPTNEGVGPDYQYYYNYENGLLAEYYYIQYKDMGVWSDAKDHTLYTYNEQGQLVRKENIYTYNEMYEYKYDEQGRLIEYTKYGKNDRNNPDAAYDKPYSTIEYSDFDANNNPQRMDYTDHLYATGSYFVFFTYDAMGRVLVEESWKPSQDNASGKVGNYKYENVYDEYGVNVDRIKSNRNWDTDGFIYASRETRTRVSETQYDFVSYNYVERDQEWAQYRTHTEYYAVLDGAYAPRDLKVDYINNANFVNAVQLTCTVPAKEVDNAQYIIWYDWQPVDTVAAVNGKITYIAQNLPNGREVEFLVQSYDAVNDIMYNVSNAATAIYTIELAPITNLHFVEQTVGFFTDGQGGQQPAYWIHFAWDAPESDVEILGYNVYEQGWVVPQSFTTNTCDSISVYRESDFNSPDQQKEIGVEVTVEYVVGESERVSETFSISDGAVEAVKVAQAHIEGNTLYVRNVADVVVYNAAGVAVASRAAVESVDLSSLPAGIYVAAVKAGDKLQVIKFARR